MLILILGPQFAGKTVATTFLLNKYKHQLSNKNGKKKSGAIFKKKSDNRYGIPGIIKDHMGVVHKVIECEKSADILNFIDIYDIFAIEEGHFWKNLYDVILKIEEKNKIIIINGLNADYRRKSFKSISNIIPLATQIIYKSSFCNECENSAYWTGLCNKEKTLKHCKNDGELILSGGKDTYIPLCYKHYMENLKK
jgi:thymidine kinase